MGVYQTKKGGNTKIFPPFFNFKILNIKFLAFFLKPIEIGRKAKLM